MPKIGTICIYFTMINYHCFMIYALSIRTLEKAHCGTKLLFSLLFVEQNNFVYSTTLTCLQFYAPINMRPLHLHVHGTFSGA